VGFAASLFVFSHDVVLIVLGSEFSTAADLLRIYSFSCIFVFVGLLSTKWMILTDKRGFVLLVTGIGCSCNIALNLILVPRYGAVGAAYATLVSYSMVTVFCDCLFSSLSPNLSYKVRAVDPRYGIQLMRSMYIKREP
jgi:O-antigen/teichoic acid export membrane protein